MNKDVFNISTTGRLVGNSKYESETFEELILPSEINGNPVNEVESNGFYRWNIKKLVIPPNYSRIRARAFRHCNIEEILIESGKDEKDLAFDFNSMSYNSLKSIDFPDRVWYIGKGAFEDNSKLTELTGAFGLKTIYDYAFRRCNICSLDFYQFASFVKLIKTGSFNDNPVESITLPPNTVDIEDGVFSGSIKEIRSPFPISMKEIKAIGGISDKTKIII